jgi:ATP-dependent Lhr-like helicase
MLYDTFANLETLGVCRRGYFIEGMGGAQFALPGAVERLRSCGERGPTLVLAAADPAQPYGGALPWPKREAQERRPARVAGAYVVLVADEPVLYVERGGRGLVTLADAPAAGEADQLREALGALAEAVRSGRVPKLALERIDGEPAIASELADELIELGFNSGPRRLTLTA